MEKFFEPRPVDARFILSAADTGVPVTSLPLHAVKSKCSSSMTKSSGGGISDNSLASSPSCSGGVSSCGESEPSYLSTCNLSCLTIPNEEEQHTSNCVKYYVRGRGCFGLSFFLSKVLRRNGFFKVSSSVQGLLKRSKISPAQMCARKLMRKCLGIRGIRPAVFRARPQPVRDELFPELTPEFLRFSLICCRKDGVTKFYSNCEDALFFSVCWNFQRKFACKRRKHRVNAQMHTTLRHLQQSFSIPPGINNFVLVNIAKHLLSLSAIEKICVIKFSEISLKKDVRYDHVLDHIVGFADLAGNRFPVFADRAIVFVVESLVSYWKYPIAYHFSHSMCSGKLEQVLKDLVLELRSLGFTPAAIVTDLAHHNISALKILADLTNPGLPCIRVKCDIPFFVDTPCLLKKLASTILEYDVQFKGSNGKANKREFAGLEGAIKTAEFNNMKDFIEYQKKQWCPVLKPEKLLEIEKCLASKKKFNFKTAVDLFGIHAFCSLQVYAFVHKRPEADTIADFIILVRLLFELLNGAPPIRGCELRTPVTPKSIHHAYWKYFSNVDTDWKFVLRSPGHGPAPDNINFSYWKSNIIASQLLWKQVNRLGVQSYNMRKLTLDPLEKFFRKIRKKVICDKDISQEVFLANLKIFLFNCLSSSKCNTVEDILFNSAPELLEDFLYRASEPREKVECCRITTEREGSLNSSLQECFIGSEMEVSSRWIDSLSCSVQTEQGSEMAHNLFVSFLHNHKFAQCLFSCFSCYKSAFSCPHAEPNKLHTCGTCSLPNMLFANEILKGYVSCLQELKQYGHSLNLTEKLDTCLGKHLQLNFACGAHEDIVSRNIKKFVISKSIRDYCTNINKFLHDLAESA